jgi:hypothetical protein
MTDLKHYKENATKRYIEEHKAVEYNSPPIEELVYLMERYAWLYHGEKIDDPGIDYAYQLMANGGGTWRHNWMGYTIEGEGQAVGANAYTILHAMHNYRRMQYQPALNPFDHNILGHLKKAKFLIIGEMVNNNDNSPWYWPFYAYRNSSKFFAQCMAEINFDEELAMWTNMWIPSIMPDGKPAMSPHIEPLIKQGLIPVLLGINVMHAFSLHFPGVRHRILPHPQNVARFGGKFEYLEMMKETFDWRKP